MHPAPDRWRVAIAGHGLQVVEVAAAPLPQPTLLPWGAAFEDGFTDSMATIGVPYVVASRDHVDMVVCGRPLEVHQRLSDGLGAVVWNTVRACVPARRGVDSLWSECVSVCICVCLCGAVCGELCVTVRLCSCVCGSVRGNACGSVWPCLWQCGCADVRVAGRIRIGGHPDAPPCTFIPRS
jgi:hypothetical protein